MPGVSKEQIQAAREVDLLAYLQAHEPEELKRQGSGYRHKTHSSLVYHRDYWYWNSQGKRMNALDYLVEIRGERFVDAVQMLCNLRPAPEYAPRPQQARERTTFKLPPPNKYSSKMTSYLQSRGIHPDIISRCMQQNILFESWYKQEPIAVFVGRDDTGIPRFGSIRGINSDLKMDVLGSDKKYGFVYPAEQSGSCNLAVFESAIDALSHASMQKLEGEQWDGQRLSLSGTSPLAALSYLQRHPETQNVNLHLDNDQAGLQGAKRIQERILSDKQFSHIKVSIKPPSQGKDFNEALKITMHQLNEEHLQQHRHQKAGISC